MSRRAASPRVCLAPQEIGRKDCLTVTWCERVYGAEAKGQCCRAKSAYPQFLHQCGIDEREDDQRQARGRLGKAKTGLSRSTLYAYVATGAFPMQRRLGRHRVAWLASR